MKLVRYKNLSQFIDTSNLYKNMDLLGDVFMFGNEYFVFMKMKTTNEVWMTRETFAGGFKVVKIPFNTWGVTVDRFDLIKYYSFVSIGVNLLSFKINIQEYATIVIDNADHVAVYIDNTDDTEAMNFIRSACPLACTKSGSNQTIQSFNNAEDGTNSTMLFSTAIDWTAWNDINPTKISSILNETEFSDLAFNILTLDLGSSNTWTYSMIGEQPSIYITDFNHLKSTIFNQLPVDTTYQFDATSLLSYVSSGLSDGLSLVFFNNNSLIYYDNNTGNYIYKNIFIKFTAAGFDSAAVFAESKTRFNLFKQILVTFRDVSDVERYRLSKAIVTTDTFMRCETNLNMIKSTINKTASTSYFTDIEEVRDIVAITDSTATGSLSKCNYAIR